MALTTISKICEISNNKGGAKEHRHKVAGGGDGCVITEGEAGN